MSTSPTLRLSKTISHTKFPVLLAKSSSDDTEYIVKAFTRDSFSRSSYLREKRALSSVNHQNIISYVSKDLFSLEISEGNYIIMEYAPYGDFFNLTLEKNFSHDKLVRTYFHQLIQGLEHIHNQGLAHLDVKLENLLLGKDYLLKIADFDVAQQVNDQNVLSQGSVNYRAPELYCEECENYQAADIYSAGVCLFTMLTKAFPFIEDEEEGGFERYDTFVNENGLFWDDMEKLLKNRVKFSSGLKELLNGMWNVNPKERFTLDKIKGSKWYRGSVYNYEELKAVVQQVLRK